MALAVADTLRAPAAATRGRFGRGTPAVLPISLGFDGTNPDHICLRCPITGTVPEGTLVRIQHKPAGASTWIDGMFMNRIRLADLGTLPAAVAAGLTNSFVGMAFAVAAASTTPQPFDVRLAVYPPSAAPVQYVTGTHTLRALEAAAPAVTHTCTTANFSTVLASLPHQSGAPVHLRLTDGTYPWASLAWTKGGTAGSPIYVSAATLGGVVISTPSGVCLRPQSSHVVFERLRFQGSGVDSGTAATSEWMAIPGGAPLYTNWTVRDCEVLGFDVGAKSFAPVHNFHLRRTKLVGNNDWPAAFAPNGFGQANNNATWNDHGICLPGIGNSAVSCEITGFGDSWRTYANSDSKQYTAGCGMTWCDIRNSGDDMAEFDGSCGNSYAFECRGRNVGNGISADDTYGPCWVIKPLIINPSRGPLKLTSNSFGVKVINGTFVMTGKGPADHGLLVPGGGTQDGFSLINCAVHYTGAGNALHWSSGLLRDAWANNAWHPDRGFLINGVGNYSTLAAAKTGNPARFANDVILGAQPFAVPIALGATCVTEYTGAATGQLASGNAARNAGTPVAGVTDGYTGAAPDIGCVIAGQAAPVYGVPTAAPSWERPAPGAAAQIGYTTGAHPQGKPAVFNSLDPVNFPSWNPGPASGPWGGTGLRGSKNWNSANDYGGVFWADTTQQAVTDGGGHVAFCPSAPQAFNSSDLSYSWLATPLPSDGLSLCPADMTAGQIDAAYPGGQVDTSWGEWLGSYTGNASQYQQPGKIFPFSGHAYYGRFWVPGSAHGNTNGAIIICSAGTGNGQSTGINACHHFDLDTGTYQRAANKRVDANSTAAGGTIYHPGVGKGFAFTSGSTAFKGAFDVYDPATRTWSRVTTTNQVVAVADACGLGAWFSSAEPQGLLFNFVPENSSGNAAYNLATSVQVWAMSAAAATANGGTWTRLAVSATSWPQILAGDGGDITGPTCAAIGWCFVPALNSFFAVNGQHGSNTLWRLSPPAGATTLAQLLAGTWTVTTQTWTGAALESRRGAGIGTGARFVYNRLVFNSAKNCLQYIPQGLTDRVTAITPAGL